MCWPGEGKGVGGGAPVQAHSCFAPPPLPLCYRLWLFCRKLFCCRLLPRVATQPHMLLPRNHTCARVHARGLPAHACCLFAPIRPPAWRCLFATSSGSLAGRRQWGLAPRARRGGPAAGLQLRPWTISRRRPRGRDSREVVLGSTCDRPIQQPVGVCLIINSDVVAGYQPTLNFGS